MNDRDSRNDDSDLAALPPELGDRSLSRTSIILPVDDALRALELLAARGRLLQQWEGWVKMRDGGRARSLAHGGSFALPREAERSAAVASAGIRRAQAIWDRDPEYPGASLYIALTFTR